MNPFDMEACRAFCERRDLARELSSKPLEINRPAPMLQYEPQRSDNRPLATSREPCPRCHIRGDLGCAHQRPFVALPVPIVPPGQREGRRRYDSRAMGAGE